MWIFFCQYILFICLGFFQEKAARRKSREEALKKHREKKEATHKKLSKRTARGQPVIKYQMEYLLQKIQSQNQWYRNTRYLLAYFLNTNISLQAYSLFIGSYSGIRGAYCILKHKITTQRLSKFWFQFRPYSNINFTQNRAYLLGEVISKASAGPIMCHFRAGNSISKNFQNFD